MIPQRGKRSNNKKGCGKTGLTPDLLWLALCCFLCGEGMEECLFICFVHPHFLRHYRNLNWQPFGYKPCFTNIWPFATLYFRPTPRLSLNHPDSE